MAVFNIFARLLTGQQVCAQVQTDEYGFALAPLVPGQLMAQHYIRFKTMVAICNIPSPAGLPDLLMSIARSADFSSIKLRRSEKKPLNVINKGSSGQGEKAHAVRFSVPDAHKPQKTKERISSGPEKIFVMVCGLSCPEKAVGCVPADLFQAASLLTMPVLQPEPTFAVCRLFANYLLLQQAWSGHA